MAKVTFSKNSDSVFLIDIHSTHQQYISTCNYWSIISYWRDGKCIGAPGCHTLLYERNIKINIRKFQKKIWNFGIPNMGAHYTPLFIFVGNRCPWYLWSDIQYIQHSFLYIRFFCLFYWHYHVHPFPTKLNTDVQQTPTMFHISKFQTFLENS